MKNYFVCLILIAAFIFNPMQEAKGQAALFILIFGDKEHPEVKGVKSYGNDDVQIVQNTNELKNIKFKYDKIATIAQTTKKKEVYMEIVNTLILKNKEVPTGYAKGRKPNSKLGRRIIVNL